MDGDFRAALLAGASTLLSNDGVFTPMTCGGQYAIVQQADRLVDLRNKPKSSA